MRKMSAAKRPLIVTQSESIRGHPMGKLQAKYDKINIRKIILLSAGFQMCTQKRFYILLLAAHILDFSFSTSDTFSSAAVRRASHERNTSDKVLIYYLQ